MLDTPSKRKGLMSAKRSKTSLRCVKPSQRCRYSARNGSNSSSSSCRPLHSSAPTRSQQAGSGTHPCELAQLAYSSEQVCDSLRACIRWLEVVQLVLKLGDDP